MMHGTGSSNANADIDARKALWREICEAAAQLAGHCTVTTSNGRGASGRIEASQPIPSVPTWQLVEGISLLSILLRANSVQSRSVSLFGKLGPLTIEEDGATRYVWAQQQLRGDYSNLGGRPDLIVTSSPGSSNARERREGCRSKMSQAAGCAGCPRRVRQGARFAGYKLHHLDVLQSTTPREGWSARARPRSRRAGFRHGASPRSYHSTAGAPVACGPYAGAGATGEPVRDGA